MHRCASRLFPLFALATLAAGCAVNPVTGEREFVLFTEDQEIQMGQEADQDIQVSFGEYDDPELQNWIDEMGRALAEDSERPDLPWTFRVLDDPTVNAFALPGGYIYVTRGILAHFNSDAELAGVLGHEIGHVTARHGITRVSQAQLVEAALGVGMVLAPELRPFSEALGVGAQLLFLSYSRDAERQADDLGLRYMAREDYDPRAVARVFEMLAGASGAQDGERLPGFLSTHPDPLERRDRILERTTGESPDFTGARDDREALLQRLDGMAYGPDPRQGYFLETSFLHPEMAFRLDFPSGWRTANLRTEVQGVAPEEDAAMVLTVVEEDDPAAALDAFVGAQGMEVGARSDAPVNGLPAATAEFRANTQSGAFRGRALFVHHGGRTFQVLGYAPEERWSARRAAIEGALGTFRAVTDPEVLDVQPRRIEVVRTDAALTLEQFQQRHPSTVPLEAVGLINGIEPGERIPAGTLMKRVVGEAPPGAG